MVAITSGTGLALAKSMLDMFWNQEDFIKSVHLISRFRNGDGAIFRSDPERQKKKFTTIYALDMDRKDGWEIGFVTELMPGTPSKDFGKDYSAVVVRPPSMMEFTDLGVFNQGVPEGKIWVSFERRMSCAVGEYGHYRVDEVYVCLDGPVFNHTQTKYPVD